MPLSEPDFIPLWEQPILKYQYCEDLIQAHHAITKREDRKDIEVRTGLLEIELEGILLHKYMRWCEVQLQEMPCAVVRSEKDSFYAGLWVGLVIDERKGVLEIERLMVLAGGRDVYDSHWKRLLAKRESIQKARERAVSVPK